jgi:hypothetical protein
MPSHPDRRKVEQPKKKITDFLRCSLIILIAIYSQDRQV